MFLLHAVLRSTSSSQITQHLLPDLPKRVQLAIVHVSSHLHAPPDGVQRVADAGRREAAGAAQRQVGDRALGCAAASYVQYVTRPWHLHLTAVQFDLM